MASGALKGKSTMNMHKKSAFPVHDPILYKGNFFMTSTTQTSTYPRYERYKDSGVEWLGEIPEGWEIRRSKFLFSQRKENAWADDIQLSATQAYGVIPQEEYEAKVGRKVVKIQFHLDKRKHVEKDDFVISMRSFQGGLERAYARGCIRSSYVILKPLQQINAAYYSYLLKLPSYIEALQQTANFIRDGQDLNFNNFSQVDLFIPPLDEQNKVAMFLDQKTTAIDTAIEKKQRLIELLKEQKAILINRAVTRGLNPDVPMKDSGVEWIGEIPAHWDLKRFKFCCSITSGQVDPRTEPYASMALIAPNHIESNTGVLFNIETAKSQGADSGKYLVDKEDIIYSKIRPALRKACISPVNGLCSADMYVLKPSNFMNKGFLLYYLLSDAFTKPALDAAMRVAMPKVNREAMSEFPIVIPNLFEQEQIYSYIDDIHQKSSQVIVAIQKEVKLLQEYKQTLISHAVTGKIKVS